MNQVDLFTTSNRQNIGNKERDIYSIVENLRKNKLLIPDFQREFCWGQDKVSGWIKTIIDKSAIGVIVTYQLDEENSPTYLADGVQRLTATIRFMENPSRYGYKFGTEQAIDYCKDFDVTVQHRIYRNHEEALQAFKNINSGTGLTPEEFYKGDLALVDGGIECQQAINAIMDRYERRLITSGNFSRMQRSTIVRDNVALFLQYSCAEKRSEFWGIANRRIGRSSQISVERLLADFIRNNSLDSIQKKIANFESFVAAHFAFIDSMASEISPGVPFSVTTSRFLIHLEIWRKNNQRSVFKYQEFCRNLFLLLKGFPSFTSRFTVQNKDGTYRTITLHMDKVSSAKILCEAFGIEDFYVLSRESKRTDKPSRPGYDNSHIIPFSVNGDGETFPEPRQLNRARGARVVE